VLVTGVEVHTVGEELLCMYHSKTDLSIAMQNVYTGWKLLYGFRIKGWDIAGAHPDHNSHLTTIFTDRNSIVISPPVASLQSPLLGRPI